MTQDNTSKRIDDLLHEYGSKYFQLIRTQAEHSLLEPYHEQAKSLIMEELRLARIDLLRELYDDDTIVYFNDDREEDGHIFISDLKEKLEQLQKGKP